MANTYTQIYIQVVFVVKGRQNLIQKEHREDLHKYITGIVSERGQKMLAIFCMPDHTHILIGYKPSFPFADLMRDIKAGSSNYINKSNWIRGKFEWQVGYGAFSYSKSHLDRVVKYIQNQEEHHKKKKFKEEYISFLRKFEIEYNEKYLFDWVETD